MKYQITGLTLAVFKMKEMLEFYSAIFGIEFIEEELEKYSLYSGEWGDLKLVFCPAKIAKVKADQNRHQFDVIVSDLSAVVKLAKEWGGEVIGEIQKNSHDTSVGIYDPDKNSITFKAFG